ncbi:unnamed protein product, partial [Iphiclides podalirius]
MAEGNTDIPEPTNEVLSEPALPSERDSVIRDTFETVQPFEAVARPGSPALMSPNRPLTISHSPAYVASPRFSPTRVAAAKSPPLPQSPSPGSVAKVSVKSSVKSDRSAKPAIVTGNPNSPSAKSVVSTGKGDIIQTIIDLEPQGRNLTDHMDELNESVRVLSNAVENPSNSPVLNTNINKIANMSKILTDEANALRESIKSLSKDISRTKRELAANEEDVNFPYHLFLIELIINKIHMKCECFELDHNHLVINAAFLGKQPIVLYDASYGKVDSFAHLNVGKSALFAMTYDKICSIKEFVIKLQIAKQPPCSSCVTKVGEARADYTKEFVQLREELCRKWTEERPNDNILCTTSTPMNKNMFYVWCGEIDESDSIGIVEMSTRMSFLGKEITTAFIASPKQQGTTLLQKEDNGMTMFSCQDVEMDGQGKIYLDEDSLNRKEASRGTRTVFSRRTDSPVSQFSSTSSKPSFKRYGNKHQPDGMSKFDEIFTKMNTNELKIRVPKTTKVERMGKYDRIQEICSCENTPHNTGEQIQFELPRDLCYPAKAQNTYSSNLKYTIGGKEKSCDSRDRKIINVTPSNCPVPVNMEKLAHPQKDVFILKIGKKLETKDKKTDLEIELVTPKAPSNQEANNHIAQQCSAGDLKKKPSALRSKKKPKEKLKSKSKAKAWAILAFISVLPIPAGLGEFRIRDLNDEINKLMREKRHWEVQIRALGGPDHARVGPKMLDQDGREVPGNRGYKYFGAAKDLPGVRELFEQEPPAPARRTRADLMRDVDADYYGYRDDDDGLLVPLEKEAEKVAIARAVEEWRQNKEQNKDQELPEEENIYPEDPDDKRIDDDDVTTEKSSGTSLVAVPSQKDIEEALLRRKKQELLERYGCLDVKMETS